MESIRTRIITPKITHLLECRSEEKCSPKQGMPFRGNMFTETRGAHTTKKVARPHVFIDASFRGYTLQTTLLTFEFTCMKEKFPRKLFYSHGGKFYFSTKVVFLRSWKQTKAFFTPMEVKYISMEVFSLSLK